MNYKSIIFVLTASVLTSCVVVSPGTVGVKNKLGKLDNKVIQPGIVGLNPLITRVITVPTRTVNLEVRLNLPSKEGLNVFLPLLKSAPAQKPRPIPEIITALKVSSSSIKSKAQINSSIIKNVKAFNFSGLFKKRRARFSCLSNLIVLKSTII